MNKVVYNACYGGFSLSREAILLAREMTGDPRWGAPCIKGDKYDDGTEVDADYGRIRDRVKRHDPILLRVVVELGEKASGKFARLKIQEIKGSIYRIDEYDGMETVVTPDEVEHEWVRI